MKYFQTITLLFIINLPNLYSQCDDIIIADSSFESGIFIYDSTWMPDDGVSIVTSPVFQGNYAVCSIGGGVYQRVSVVPNTTYYLSCWVKNGLYDFSLRVDHLPFGVTIDTGLVSTDNWQFVSMPFVTNNIDTVVGIRYWSLGACVDLFRLTCEELTATSSLQTQNLSIYPNPAEEKSIISLENLPDASYDLYLINANGQLVKSITNINTKQLELNRNNLSSGTYFIQLKHNNEVKAVGKWLLK